MNSHPGLFSPRTFRVIALDLLLVPLLLAGVMTSVMASVAAANDAHASDAAKASPALAYRQTVMSIIGTNMGAIGDIMKNGLEVPGAVANHADQMARSAALIAPAFTKQGLTGPTDAKPEIWQDWAKFEKAITDFEQAAENLRDAAQSGDAKATGQAMRALGKSCGGCHKPFRKPKEESYKNQ